MNFGFFLGGPCDLQFYSYMLGSSFVLLSHPGSGQLWRSTAEFRAKFDWGTPAAGLRFLAEGRSVPDLV